jgi:hypothetical protein
VSKWLGVPHVPPPETSISIIRRDMPAAGSYRTRWAG